MSALMLVLPLVHATSSSTSIATAAVAVEARKAPHRLHLVRACASVAAPYRAAQPLRPMPQFAFYRKYTEAMLKRYQTMSMESGRVPSLLGQDLFRGRVSSCRVTGFDDVVIYVHDVGRCLAKLSEGQQYLVRRIALEGYTQGETAALSGISLRTVIRHYNEALDRLTRMLLERGLLETAKEANYTA